MHDSIDTTATGLQSSLDTQHSLIKHSICSIVSSILEKSSAVIQSCNAAVDVRFQDSCVAIMFFMKRERAGALLFFDTYTYIDIGIKSKYTLYILLAYCCLQAR